MRDQSVTPSAPEVRELDNIAELRETEAIQREVWGLDDIDVVPAAQMRAAVHAGGQVAGAFDAGAMVGFAYGLVAAPHGRDTTGVGLHSHMVAVREQGRQRGVGRALKWFQRRWCLERGMTWITWTFDPLQARNANLNFEHLGVTCHEYLVDFYGAMAGPLGGSASDRLVALWQLDSEPVRQRADGTAGEQPLRDKEAPGQEPEPVRELWVLTEADVAAASGAGHAENGPARAAASAVQRDEEFLAALAEPNTVLRLRVAAPRDVAALKRDNPALVESWRSGLRAALIPALGAGYSIVAFRDGAYVLERHHGNASTT